MKTHAEVDALLSLLAESESFEPTDWDTSRLEFEESLSSCPTMAELASFTELHKRIGQSVFEDPHTALIATHIGSCRTCRLRKEALQGDAGSVQTTPVAARRTAPTLWKIAASILGLGALTWFAMTPPGVIDKSGARVATVSDSIPAALRPENALPRSITHLAGVDIAPLERELDSEGRLIQPFEIAVPHGFDIEVLNRGWQDDCDCDRWNRCKFVISETTDTLVYYRAEVAVEPQTTGERSLQVIANRYLPAGTVSDDVLCCLDHSSSPEQCGLEGFVIASTEF